MTLPALPFLCRALAFDTHTVSNDSMFLFGSNLFSFIRPTSITKTQSSIVIDVSAMFVEITIFLCPALGLKCTRILETV